MTFSGDGKTTLYKPLPNIIVKHGTSSRVSMDGYDGESSAASGLAILIA